MDTAQGQLDLFKTMERIKTTRADLIAQAREIADRKIMETGGASTADIMAELEVPEGIDGRWLGAVFRDKKYKWSGRVTEGYKGPTTHPSPKGVHLAKVWEFADEARNPFAWS